MEQYKWKKYDQIQQKKIENYNWRSMDGYKKYEQQKWKEHGLTNVSFSPTVSVFIYFTTVPFFISKKSVA